MSSEHSLFKIFIEWPDGLRLEVINSKLKGRGSLEYVSEFEGASIYAEKAEESEVNSQTPSLSVQIDPDGVFFPCRLRENCTYDIFVYVPKSQNDCETTLQHSDFTYVWPFQDPRLDGYINVIQPRLWQEDRKNAEVYTLIAAFFNPRGHVGVVDFTVLDENHSMLFEVLSSKIEYPEDFKSLLNELAEEHLRLVYQLDAPSSIHLRGRFDTKADLATTLFHLRNIMDDNHLPEAVETVINNPLSQLIVEDDVIDIWSAEHIDPCYLVSQISQLEVRPGGPLKRLMRGYSPVRVPIQQQTETRDTPENRYVKAFVQDLYELLIFLEKRLADSKKIIAEIQVRGWKNKVLDWLSSPVWKGIGPMTDFPSNSQILQRSVGYRDILAYDLQLREGLVLPWKNIEQFSGSQLLGDVRPIHDLYEYWCFFILRGILRELFGPESNAKALFEETDGLSLRLARGVCSHIEFSYLGSQILIHLFYNRSFRPGRDVEWGDWAGSYSALFHPDISIAISGPNLTHWLHFDAKYRVDIQTWGKAVSDMQQEEILAEQRAEEIGKYKRADLYKMHCYRDAILGSRGAYILYPGKNINASAKNIFVRLGRGINSDAQVPGVGAFALSPGNSGNQTEILKQFISDIVTALASASDYSEEYGLASKNLGGCNV